MNRKYALLTAAVGGLAVGCSNLAADQGGVGGGDAPGGGGGDQTGGVEFLTTAPTGAQCIRIVATPATGAAITKTFTVTAGASTATLSLGVLPTGTIGFTGDAFTVACTALSGATSGWTADPASATIRAGVITNLSLTFRPRNPVNVSVNFVRNILGVVASGSTSGALTDGPPEIWGYASGGWNTPTVFTPPADAIAFAAGVFHACIIRKDGSVWCWGANSDGQLGPGVPVGSGNLNATQVPLPGPASLVSAGQYHTCAYVTAPSSVYCWGKNDNLQIGSPTLAQSATPIQVPNTSFPIVRTLSSGSFHNIAATGDGRYYVWGRNAEGQFGNGNTTGSATALYEQTDNAVQAAAAGEEHSCSLHADGSVWCWGGNGYGQLGDGTNAPHSMPAPVQGLPAAATHVSAGQFHTCARLVDGRVACWGRNDEGEIGDLTSTARKLPSQTGVCWGYNGAGQIGDGTSNNAYAPVKITLQ